MSMVQINDENGTFAVQVFSDNRWMTIIEYDNNEAAFEHAWALAQDLAD